MPLFDFSPENIGLNISQSIPGVGPLITAGRFLHSILSDIGVFSGPKDRLTEEEQQLRQSIIDRREQEIFSEATPAQRRDIIRGDEDLTVRTDFEDTTYARAFENLVNAGLDPNDPDFGSLMENERSALPDVPADDPVFTDSIDQPVFDPLFTDETINDVVTAVVVGNLGDQIEAVDAILHPQVDPGIDAEPDVSELEEEEEKTMPSFGFGDFIDVITDVWTDGGPGDIMGPDLVDVVQGVDAIWGLFTDDDTSTVPTVTTTPNTTTPGGPRTMTPLQVVNACAKAKTGRGISKKRLKAMARTCGLAETAATIGCSIQAVCLVVSSPTRRRTGISSADMRKTRSTVRKLKTMYKSIPTRGRC